MSFFFLGRMLHFARTVDELAREERNKENVERSGEEKR